MKVVHLQQLSLPEGGLDQRTHPGCPGITGARQGAAVAGRGGDWTGGVGGVVGGGPAALACAHLAQQLGVLADLVLQLLDLRLQPAPAGGNPRSLVGPLPKGSLPPAKQNIS